MAKHLHMASAPMISVRTRRKANLAVTRLRSETGLVDRTTPFACERAFTVQLHLRPVSPVKFWLHGRPVSDEPVQEGSVSIMHLEHEPSMYLGSAFDMVQFYVPRAALDEFADENDGCRCETLTWPFGKVDPRLKSLALCLLPVLERPELSSELYVDHLVFAAHAYIARTYGGIKIAPSIVRGGLAPWQLHRATDMLKANLDGQIALSQVARECKLSVSHFVRAFKQTIGQPPYRWLLQQRIDAAKELLLHSEPANGGDRAQVWICGSGMFHPGIPKIARHHPWGVAADTHAIAAYLDFLLRSPRQNRVCGFLQRKAARSSPTPRTATGNPWYPAT